MNHKVYLVTGAAGFIGFHVAKRLLRNKKNIVVGIDNINNYYSPELKYSRLRILKYHKNFIFKKIDILKNKKLLNLFEKYKFYKVIHLAAQAGVRYSLKKPKTYIYSNILGFFNIIELSKKFRIRHFVYASSSSVYGSNTNHPFSETSEINKPIQIYAATKIANESIAHSYSSLYGLKTSGVRFFSVYGPWGRPDQALFTFTNQILNNKKIDLFNNGNHTRDFTYIDDLVDGIIKIVNNPPKKKQINILPYEIFNLGSGKSIKLKKYLYYIEKFLKRKVKINYLPLQKGDMVDISSDISKAKKLLSYYPKVQVNEGIKKFLKWYLEFYNQK